MKVVAFLLITGCPVYVSAAVPIATLTENWDDYAVGRDDPAYNEKWATLPDSTRYEIVTGPAGAATVWSAPNGLKIGKQVRCGITRDLTAEIEAALPGATEMNGTDESPLKIFFIVDFNRDAGTSQDIFIELSKGDVHVDETSGTEKEVVAFGMTNGLLGESISPRVFNGMDWVEAVEVITDKRSNHFTLEIKTDTLVITGSQKASGTQVIERSYLGGFNRISIRTVFNNHRAHILDNVLVEGGEVTGGPTETLFKRGDANSDGNLDIADAIAILGYLFGGGEALSCMDTGDANDDGNIDIADAIAVFGHLFASTGDLPDPFTECGTDPTEDELGCESFAPCENG